MLLTELCECVCFCVDYFVKYAQLQDSIGCFVRIKTIPVIDCWQNKRYLMLKKDFNQNVIFIFIL